MTHTETSRPASRSVRVVAVLTLVVAVVLLGVGGLVTSMRAGMSDDKWPTEPWFLLSNGQVWAEEPRPGFLIEHSHRLLGFVVGGLAVLLAGAAWWGEPDRTRRLAGLVAVGVLVTAFGAFHAAMMQSQKLGKTLTPTAVATGAASAAGFAASLAIAAWGVRGGSRGAWVRGLSVLVLACVMAQGLLGGLRVFLNELVGTNLAAVHGVFGQLTFALLTAVVVLAAPRRAGDALPAAERAFFIRAGVVLLAVLVVQLVWAVMVRHVGTPLAQRLHMLTAFLATGVAVFVAVRVLCSVTAKPRLGGASWNLLGVLALQLTLGVEAYMGKFAASAPQATLPAELRPVTLGPAVVRTSHQLVGAGLLAAAAAFAVRAGRRPAGFSADFVADEGETAAANRPEPVGVS